jgi:hypothetical protein
MLEYSTSGGYCPRSLTLAKALEPDHFPLPNQGLVGNESGVDQVSDFHGRGARVPHGGRPHACHVERT